MAFGRKREDPPVPANAGPSPVADAPAAPAEAEAVAGGTATPAPAAVDPAPAPAPARRAGRTPAGGDQLAMRLVATAGIVGIGVAIGAILVGQNVAGWITGLVVSLAAMVLMAVVWGPRRG